MSLSENYQCLLTGEGVNEATENIMALYEMDGILDEWAGIMADPSAAPIHQAAATGLKLLIGKQWASLKENLTPELLHVFVEIIQAQSEKNVELIVNGLGKILAEVGERWEELYEVAFALMEPSQKPRIASIILSESIIFCSSDFIRERVEALCGFIQANAAPITAATTNEDANHILRVYNIFAQILTKDPPIFDSYPEEVGAIFTSILQGYVEFITKPYTFSGGPIERNANKIAESIKIMISATNPVIDPAQMVGIIVETLQNESLNSDLAYTIFDPLSELIIDFPDAIRESFGDLLGLILRFAESRYKEGETYSNQSYEIADVSRAIASNMQPSDFIEVLFQQINASIEAGIDSGIFVIDEVMTYITEGIEESPNQVMELLLSPFGQQLETLVQGAVSALAKMSVAIPSVCEQYNMDILTGAFPYLESEEIETINGVLNLFVEILSNTSVESSTVKEVVDAALAVFNANDEAKEAAMYVFAAAIECAQETSVLFFEEISEPILTFFQSEEDEAVPIKCAAISCIGNIIAFCKDCVSDSIDELIGGILENLTFDEEKLVDLDVQKNSLLAFNTILDNQINQLEIKDVEVVITSIIGVTLSVFDRFYDQYANENDDEKSQEILEQLKSLVKLQTSALKFVPEKLKLFAAQMQEQESSEHWKILQILENSYKLYFEQEERLIPDFLDLGEALLYYSDPAGDEPPEFWKIYFENLVGVFSQESDPETSDESDVENWIDVITHALGVIASLAEKNHPMIAQSPNDFFVLAIQTLHRDLPISKSLGEDAFRYDPELIPTAQTAAINLINTYKDAVDIGAFIQQTLEIVEKVSDNEKCIMFAVYAELPKLIEIPDEIIQFAVQVLPLCNFSHSPDPIYFFNQMLQYRKEQIEGILGDLFTNLTALLQNEQTKDRYYWETVANSASLALLIYNSFPQQIDIASLLPHIVDKIPYKGDFTEGRNIVENILVLFGTQRDIVLQVAGEVFRGFVVISSLNEKEYSKYQFTQTDAAGITNFIKFILQNSAELQAQLPEILGGDEVKAAQFTKRTSIEL